MSEKEQPAPKTPPTGEDILPPGGKLPLPPWMKEKGHEKPSPSDD